MRATKQLIIGGLGIAIANVVGILIFVRVANPGHGDLELLLVPMVLMVVSVVSVGAGSVLGAYTLFRDPSSRTIANMSIVTIAFLLLAAYALWQRIP